MWSLIVGIFLAVLCIYKRFIADDGLVEGEPLGMPRGTVRAYITILIVVFPISYLLAGLEPPSFVVSSLFLLVAFYFQARKGGAERIRNYLKKYLDESKFKSEQPLRALYLPKYSVRFILGALLIAIFLINTFGPRVTFEATSSLIELLINMFLFIIGILLRTIGHWNQHRKVKKFLEGEISKGVNEENQLFDLIMGRAPSWWEKTGKSILSVILLISVITALIFYTVGFELLLFDLGFISLTVPELLLLFTTVYYGLRD